MIISISPQPSVEEGGPKPMTDERKAAVIETIKKAFSSRGAVSMDFAELISVLREAHGTDHSIGQLETVVLEFSASTVSEAASNLPSIE